MTSRSNPSVSSLIVASGAAVVLSWIPLAGMVTYPFLIFSTFIHETFHALAALLTFGSVDSITVSYDGSGLTFTRGGFRWLVSSAGYLGTALFGGLLLVVSKNPKFVRPAIAGCALLVALITALYVGHANNALVLGMLAVILGLLALSFGNKNVSRRVPAIVVTLVLSGLLMLYLTVTNSLFSWIVGLLLTLGFLGVMRFASHPVAHFFLSFLAVQCSLNALYALKTLFFLSVSSSCSRTDAQNMAAATGLPPSFWAVLWMIQAIVILAFALWLFGKGPRRTSE